MHDGQNDGTSGPLTVTQAQEVFAQMLSDEEDTQSGETQETEAQRPAPNDEAPVEDERPETEVAESDEEADEAEESQKPVLHKVKVDGEEIEVTLEELLKGYSRTADYTRKTQKLAENVKAFEAEEAAVRAERQQYATKLAQLDEALRRLTPAEPDWDRLQQENPEEFASTWAAWQRHLRRLENVAKERQEAEARVWADEQKRFEAYMEDQKAKLLEALPTWKDQEVAQKERDEMIAFAESAGFTREELSNVYDHRLILLLRKAMLHDKAEKSRKEVKQKVAEVVSATPGPAKGQRRSVSELTRRRQRLAQTGRVEDAAAVFELLDV